MDVMKIKFETIENVATIPKRNGAIISKQALEDCKHTMENCPIFKDGVAIGIMRSFDEGLIFVDHECQPEIVIKDSHMEGDITVIDKFSFSAISIGKKIIKVKE